MIKKIKRAIITTILLFLSYAPYAQITYDINQDEAFKALLAAKKKAEIDNVLVNIAVVDGGANLKAFIRMNESFLGSIDVVIKKAKTARYFNIDTGKLGEWTQPGGLPIKNKNGKIIGAIGVSGGTVDEDRAIAKAGADTILNFK